MAEHAVITEVIPKDDKLDKFKQDISRDADIADEQREAANEDMRFVNVTGGMWEGDYENASNHVKLEFDMASDFLNRSIGEWNQNRSGVEFKSDDFDTSSDDVDLINGIYRADFLQNKGKLSTDNAVDEAYTCGYGVFKLATEFVDEGDPENFDQRIVWRPIHNAYNKVYWDQSAECIDKSDARWVTVLKTYTVDEFEGIWPDKTATSAYTPQTFRRTIDITKPNFIFIATRYEIVRKKKAVFVYDNIQTGKREVYIKDDHELIGGELKADDTREFLGERKKIIQTVEKTVFSGEDILEKTRRTAGKWLPLIPVYGYRAYVDDVEKYRGVIRKLKDPQRLFNMQVSQLAESSASSGQEVPIFDPRQIEGADMKNLWADKNNVPYLLAKALQDDEGKILHVGPIAYLKPSQLDGASAALMQVTPDYLNRVTGGVMLDSLDPDASGKAIKEVIKRANMNVQVINDNIANAIAWSGTVYQSMAAEIYSAQRRIKTIGKDGTEGDKLLMQTVLNDDGQLIEANTLAGKRFHSYSDAGPQYETMREETVEDLKGMIELLKETPNGEQYLPVVLSVLMDNISGVGLDPIRELNRRIMLLNGSRKPETDEDQAILDQARQPKEDPQGDLVRAAAKQQIAEAENLQASSIQKLADAEKKKAETVEIFDGIDMGKLKVLLEQLDVQQAQTFENLPIQ